MSERKFWSPLVQAFVNIMVAPVTFAGQELSVFSVFGRKSSKVPLFLNSFKSIALNTLFSSKKSAQLKSSNQKFDSSRNVAWASFSTPGWKERRTLTMS